jgi:DNA-binding transcriptional LysR family regulator
MLRPPETSGLDAIATFAAILEAGSLSAAARAHGLSKATLSRTLAGLERDLGVGLVERRAGGLVPTPAGRALAERARPALAELEHVRSEARRAGVASEGKVRVSAPPELGGLWLGAALRAFLSENDGVDVELSLTSRVIDLAREGFDVTVRAGRVEDPSVRMRLLGRTRPLLVASPDFLRRTPPIRAPRDLERVSCLTLAIAEARTWELVEPPSRAHRIVVSGRFASNDLASLHDAALAGLGVARLPEALCRVALRRGALVEVLATFECPSRAYYVVTPAGRLPARVRALVQALVEHSASGP